MEKKIAIAVDGSQPATQAVHYAATMAAFIQELTIVRKMEDMAIWIVP